MYISWPKTLIELFLSKCVKHHSLLHLCHTIVLAIIMCELAVCQVIQKQRMSCYVILLHLWRSASIYGRASQVFQLHLPMLYILL